MPWFDMEQHLLLTAAERETLRLLAQGLTHPEIAETLCVSVDTVHSRIRRFREKHQFPPGTETAAWAGGHAPCCIAEPGEKAS